MKLKINKQIIGNKSKASCRLLTEILFYTVILSDPTAHLLICIEIFSLRRLLTVLSWPVEDVMYMYVFYN